MKRFGMSWSGAGSNSWTNEPTDRTAGACSQIDARGSSWAPLFVYLLHPLYSLLTLLILVHSALQDRKGQVTSSRSLSFSFYVLLPALCLSSPSSFLLFLPSSSLLFPSALRFPSVSALLSLLFRPPPLFLSLAPRPLYLSLHAFVSFPLFFFRPAASRAIRRCIFFLALSLISPVHVRLM